MSFCLSCAVLIAIGAFYAFAGFIATRAALTSYFLDWALARISLQPPSRVETLRTVWLLGAAFLVLAGGLSLMLRLELAVWIFVASAFGQALYIAILAPRVFDREDPPEPAGRRQTINAFMIYTLVTAGIATRVGTDDLTRLAATPPASYALLAALLFLHLTYVAVQLLKLKAGPKDTGFDADHADAPPPDDEGP